MSAVEWVAAAVSAHMALLVNELSTLSDIQLATLAARLGPEGLQGAIHAVEAEIIETCRRDGLFFASLAKTRDEADPDNPVKPFPAHTGYVRAIWGTLAAHNKVVVAKSRQMMMSWIACMFVVWWARFRPNQAVYWMAQKWDDAVEKIAMANQAGKASSYMGRCQFIEAHLPTVLRQPLRINEGLIVYPNGSFIQALPGGADQIRGKVFSLMIADEFAFVEEARGVYQSIAPLIQKGSRFVAISTPNGGPESSLFAQLYHGHAGR